MHETKPAAQCYERVASPMSQIGTTSMSLTATALYSGVLHPPSTACIPAAHPGRESFVAVST